MPTVLFWCLPGIIFLFFLNSSDGTCTLPGALRGTWISSVFGDTEFTESIMYLSQYDIVTQSVINPTNFTCDFSSGNFYVFKTTSNFTSASVGDYKWYICLELTAVTAYSYYYYDTRANDAGRSPYTEYTDVCGGQQDTELFHVFVKKGFEAEALSYCAKPFLGVFTYTHTSTSATCGLEWGESLLDVCNNNRTNLIFDYNLCSTKVAFSDGGHVGCVAALSSGTTYYQIVINFDTTLSTSPRTYRFTCFVIEFDGVNITATEKGENCDQGQSASVKPSAPGSLLYLVANTTCYIETPASPADPSDNTAVIIAGVVVSLVVIATVIGAILGYKYYKRKKDEKLSEKTKIENLISIGLGNGLANLPKPLNKQNNKQNSSDINENKIKENDLPTQQPGVSTADTLQDVDIDPGNEKERQLQNENKETKDDEDPLRHTDDSSGLTKKDTVEDESKQINGMMMTDNLTNEVIIEEEAVDEDSVETKNTKPEKKVTFPDDVPTQGSHENPDHASLIPDVNNTAASETKKSNDERHPSPKEALTTFGKEKTGMNSRKPGPSEIRSNESEKSPLEKVEQNGTAIPSDGSTTVKNDQQFQTKSTTDLQNSETTLSTNGSKTIKLTTDNKTTSLENFPKSSQTCVNSMTPVVGDDPRAEALTNLSGLMSIVSSNPYKRFTQKANKKNTSPSEELSFKSVRPTLHSFEE